MPTLFTRIIEGQLPGHFVWRDEHAVAFLTIAPLTEGHVLVVPRLEVEHWIDLPAELNTHLFSVAQKLGRAVQHAYQPEKVGLMVAGLEVPHVHLHVLPIQSSSDLNFANAQSGTPKEALVRAAETIRASLRALGYPEVSS